MQSILESYFNANRIMRGMRHENPVRLKRIAKTIGKSSKTRRVWNKITRNSVRMKNVLTGKYKKQLDAIIDKAKKDGITVTHGYDAKRKMKVISIEGSDTELVYRYKYRIDTLVKNANRGVKTATIMAAPTGVGLGTGAGLYINSKRRKKKQNKER